MVTKQDELIKLRVNVVNSRVWYRKFYTAKSGRVYFMGYML